MIPGDFTADFRSASSYFFLSIDAIIEERGRFKSNLEDGNFDGFTARVSTGIRRAYFDADWIPFASNGLGDFICLDMNPTNSGNKGQVLVYFHEVNIRPLVAKSFGEFVDRLTSGFRDDLYYISVPDIQVRKKDSSSFPTFKLKAV